MKYILILLGLILTLFRLVFSFPLDLSFAVLPFAPYVNRTFALASFVAIGIVRDGLFLTLPWYSPLLLTVAVIVGTRVSFSWVLLALSSSAFYFLDMILRIVFWKGYFWDLEVLITLTIIWLSSYAVDRFLS
ncbi:MAG: hypothetical protein ACO2O5_05510 [Candidatus Caldipriscus sp.]